MKKSNKIIFLACLAFLSGMVINNGFVNFSGMNTGELIQTIVTNVTIFIGEMAIIYTVALGARDITKRIKERKKEKNKNKHDYVEINNNTKEKEKTDILDKETTKDITIEKESSKSNKETINNHSYSFNNNYNHSLENNNEVEKQHKLVLKKK